MYLLIYVNTPLYSNDMNNGTVYIEFFDVKFVIELGRDANLFSTI